MFKKVAIFGLGLLGGSICRALKEQDPGVHISAYGRNLPRIEPALRDGSIDAAGTFDRVSLAGVELAVVSTPVDSSIDIIRGILGHAELDPRAIVVDVGSVKEVIVREVSGLGRSAQFIGCHPIAGSEKTGYEYSRADLYNGSSVIITPHGGNSDGDIARVARFWESLGARTTVVTPEEHDRIVAYTSHLPHMIASSLVEVFHEFRRDSEPTSGIGAFIGNGFRDVTRISSGSPDMWRDIVLQNRGNISGAIDRMIGELDRLKKLIAGAGPEGGPVHDYFADAKKIRDGLK
ncbi:MAG TPA: prephenate dehydrogenase [Spirochaetota bacterium]|nr:prephenate dehydrogenase [Spirochaetota bacterium]HPC40962.1 prephenate dehydrogenase [Spirochaetota bacterium]HQF08608.1 prephenate dehydrogenase [Spirochaetota bacterium]HQH97323.1 prephenate dehydrogenase [Spirochaetota bacterium]HQJ70834.1 prephenate dehydrogenase [Spirochaetota bacterium]